MHNKLLATARAKNNAVRNNMIGLATSSAIFVSLMLAFWK